MIKKIAYISLLFMMVLSCDKDNHIFTEEILRDSEISLDFADLHLKTKLHRDLLYDRYTLDDQYFYGKTPREIQWEKISGILDSLSYINIIDGNWGIYTNYKNRNGLPPTVKDASINKFNKIQDSRGIPQNQGVPLYSRDDLEIPALYGRDGSLVRVVGDSSGYYRIKEVISSEEWLIPAKYLRYLDTFSLKKAIFVDRKNQNIATLEHVDTAWLIRSVNPATTGVYRPPFKNKTPLGIFVIQNKTPRMTYLIDGTNRYGGFAPHASRFTNGAYLHGVPIDVPRTQMVEFSPSLGTTPRSHMCVRLATSHAKFIYDWAETLQTLVCVIE